MGLQKDRVASTSSNQIFVGRYRLVSYVGNYDYQTSTRAKSSTLGSIGVSSDTFEFVIDI